MFGLEHLTLNPYGQNPLMLKFFFNAAPNPMKIALLLEETGPAF